MMRVPKREKTLVAAVSLTTAAAVMGSLFYVTYIRGIALPIQPDNLAVIALLASIFPPAVVNLMDARWRSSVDNNIPRLLSEIAEAGRTGLTLTRAIEVAAERRYGALTKELRRLVSQLSWGFTLEEALMSFAQRVDTRLARRAAYLIAEVSRAGGEVQEVLEAINKHLGDLQALENERRLQTRPYTTIVFVAFAVFLFTSILLLRTFFAELAALQEQVGPGFLALGALDIDSIKRILFHMAIIQAFFSGLVAGKMGEASVGAGLKNSLIMIAAAFLAFFFLAP